MAITIRLDDRLRERRAEANAQTPIHPVGPGSMVGSYHLRELVGEGGMGLVYKATDTVLDRTVALKILPPYLTQNPDLLHRIRTEAHAQARLQHPNIVTLYSVLEVPAGFVLVMEYVEGMTLRQYIHTHGPLEPAEAVRVFDQAMQGVAYAHEMGIVHRDLKPDNIFLTLKGEVKIMDFGVAKIVDSREPTRSRSMVGTLLYISPEQINGRDADFRSDIYTLGIGLFEAVTGRLPFERRSDYALMHAHILERPPRPRGIRGNLPKALENVILKAIEKEPGKRFQNIAAFRTALLRQGSRYGLIESDASMPPGTSTWLSQFGEQLKRRNPMFGGLGVDALLLVVVVLLVFVLGLYPGRERPQDDVEPVTRLSNKARPAAKTNMPRQKESDAARREPERKKDQYDTLRKAWGG